MSDVDIAGREFDAAYYGAMYGGSLPSGTDLLAHFCEQGWKEGKNPTDWFDTRYYLARYPDIVAAQMNPFVHFLLAGRIEGREPQRPLNPVRSVIEAARYPDWPAEVSQLGDRTAAQLLADGLASSPRRGRTIVSVSHDDYALSLGGIQNVVSDEAQEAVALDLNFLHLSPSHAGVIRLAPAEHTVVRVRLNGEAIGEVSSADLAAAIRGAGNTSRPLFVIHHLAGHSPESLASLIERVQAAATFYWAHDYFSACPSYALLRNDIEFCGGPPPSSAACRVCTYGPARPQHLERVTSFLDRVQAIVLHPSRSAARTWQKATRRALQSNKVAPLAKLLPSATVRRREGNDLPLRVAHLGARSYPKGWSQFEALAFRLRKDPRYEFLQFGYDGPEVRPSYIKSIPVAVSSGSRDAMTEALVEHQVDIAVLWSMCDETFGFTAYEAMAAGCGVVVRAGSGNVPYALAAEGWGALVLGSLDDLVVAFENGGAIADLAASDRNYGAVLSTAGSFGIVDFWQALHD